MATALGYCKLCELADFRDPELRALIREMNVVGPERPEHPQGEEHRKAWEVAMTVRALRDLGAVREDAEILGVGAGREATIFWLTNHVRRVFATDLYLTEDDWSLTDAGPAMLVHPETETNLTWNSRRLVAEHMNALELRFEDESFDGIFSSSSIEHFGDHRDIRRAIEEMYRVLKPGGVVALTTEFRLQGSGGLPGTVLFDKQELSGAVLDEMEWELAEPLDLTISDDTLRGAVPFSKSLRDKVRDRLGRILGRPEPGPQFPHLVLHAGRRLWTSVHVALVKPGG